MRIDKIKTPAYVLDESKLIRNLEILADVQERSGCRILLAQKAFSMFSVYPLIAKYLAGTTASGLYEARLGAEEMGGETHIFAPAFREDEIDEIAGICDHIIFNSISQLKMWRDRVRGRAGIGLRVNPECSTQEHAIYDPCAPGSRLGVTRDILDAAARPSGPGDAADAGASGPGDVKDVIPELPVDVLTPCGKKPRASAAQLRHLLDGVEGLHFHTLCEQNADDLDRTLTAFEEKFGDILYEMKWLNMGGGHHITRKDYDRELLIALVRHVRETYGVEVYLEPGEAIALDAGYLVTEVMDVVENAGIRTLILDASAACHMPDVLEMPYRPRVLYESKTGEGGYREYGALDRNQNTVSSEQFFGLPPVHRAGEPGEQTYSYKLSSCTCLAGDIIGDYSFQREIVPGDRLYFEDMAIYSMVKNNTFNGMRLPDIAVMDSEGCCMVQKSFGYEDFRMRLS